MQSSSLQKTKTLVTPNVTRPMGATSTLAIQIMSGNNDRKFHCEFSRCVCYLGCLGGLADSGIVNGLVTARAFSRIDTQFASSCLALLRKPNSSNTSSPVNFNWYRIPGPFSHSTQRETEIVNRRQKHADITSKWGISLVFQEHAPNCHCNMLQNNYRA